VVRYIDVQFVDQAHPADDAAGAHPPGSAVIGTCTVITTSDFILENGLYFTTSDIKSILPLAHANPTPPPSQRGTLQLAPHRSQYQHAPEPPSGPNPPPELRHHPRSRWRICSTYSPRQPLSRRRSTLSRTNHLRPRLRRSDRGELFVFVRWSSRRPGVATRRVMPLRSRAFLDLRFPGE
jgi:hypothetical protein